jgi:spore maturation protein SpmA
MALSKIWSAFIIIAISVACGKFIFNKNCTSIFSQMVVGKQGDTCNTKTIDSFLVGKTVNEALNKSKEYKFGNEKYYKLANNSIIVCNDQNANGLLTTCKDSVEICIGLIGIMAFFMGLMSIAEKAGGIRFLSRLISPFFSKLFPDVPKGHPAFGHMMLNYAANLLNLDNAATPFGIKAMQSLQELNPNKDTASNAQLMFLCLHASGLTLIPVSIIAIRSKMGASNPTDIFIPCMIATFVATVAAMLVVSFKQKINVFQPVILGWIMSLSAIIIGLVIYVHSLSKDAMDNFSGALGNGILLIIVLAIVVGAAMYKKIDVFDSFVDGAKGGFETAIKIIPYLVGMLVAISLLRTSGTFDVVIAAMKNFFVLLGCDTRFVEALPTALVRPLSGSGARGLMVDTIKNYGVDSFAARLSSIMQGSSDTTFYVVAVYYGSVAIKNIRYSIGAMLIADLVGVITSILLCYLFFG